MAYDAFLLGYNVPVTGLSFPDVSKKMKRSEPIIPGGGVFSQTNGVLVTHFLYAVVAQEEPLVVRSLEDISVYAVT